MPMVDPRSPAMHDPLAGPTEAEFMRQAASSRGAPPAPKPPPAPLQSSKAFDTKPAPPPAPKRLVPPTVDVALEWEDPDGVAFKDVLTIRILSLDERIAVTRRASHAAAQSHPDAKWDTLPSFDQEWLLAVATCLVMWPTAPEHVKWAYLNNEEIAFGLAQAVEAHRQNYFRGNAGAGPAGPRGFRVVAVEGADAPAAAQQGAPLVG